MTIPLDCDRHKHVVGLINPANGILILHIFIIESTTALQK